MPTLASLALIVLGTPAMADRRESASFKAHPSPARVYVDDVYVGVTPLELEFACGQVGDRRYRIEREGCAPSDGVLNARVAPGRIVAASFTLAINLIWQCPQYFVPVDVRLQCSDRDAAQATTTERPASADELPPRVDLRTLRTPTPLPAAPDTVRAQLSTLKDMRDRGVISEEQYREERERLLRSLGY